MSFSKRELAVAATGAEFLRSIQTNAPGIAAVTRAHPPLVGADGTANVALMTLAVPRQSLHPNEALAFALFLTNADNQARFAREARVLPSSLTALAWIRDELERETPATAGAQQVREARLLSARTLETARVLVPADQGIKRLQKILYTQLQRAMLGQLSSTEALAEARRWDQYSQSRWPESGQLILKRIGKPALPRTDYRRASGFEQYGCNSLSVSWMAGAEPLDSKATILVVDDEAAVRRVLVMRLQLSGYKVICAEDGEQALELFHSESPDLIVLDVMLPKLDGFAVCRRLRAESCVPIIFLSAVEAISERVAGLDLGADDYLPKPFSPKELEARIAPILRRVGRGNAEVESREMPTGQGVLCLGDLVVDTNRRQVTRAGERINLTYTEFSLLELLFREPGRVVPRAEILEQLWGYRLAVRLIFGWSMCTSPDFAETGARPPQS